MTAPRPSFVLLAATAVVVGGTLLTGVLAGPGPAVAAEAHVGTRPVDDAVLVCPSVGVDATTTSAVSAGSPRSAGTLTVAPLSSKASAAPLAAEAPGQTVLRYSSTRARSGPLLVHATGDRARGLTANVVTRTTGRSRSVHSVSCTQPTGDTWLVGGSTVSGRRDVVFLTNVETTPALVDVSVYGMTGVQQPASSQGLTVRARSQTTLALDALAPGLGATAVHVHVRSGRVAAALLDTAAIGNVPAGVDWVPPSVAPTRHLLVTGIPVQPDGRHLLVLVAPGGSDAQVRVRLVTPQGTLSPGPLSSISVPSGRLLTVDLGKSGGFLPPYAVLVDSDQPVEAGVWTQRGDRGQLTDFAWAGSTAPLLGGSVVLPWATQSSTAGTTLELTAPGGQDLSVRVTPLGPGGAALLSSTLTVGADRTTVLPVALLGQVVSAVLVEAASGADLMVGWASAEKGLQGPLITGGSLPQTPLDAQVPPVVADPAAGYPGH